MGRAGRWLLSWVAVVGLGGGGVGAAPFRRHSQLAIYWPFLKLDSRTEKPSGSIVGSFSGVSKSFAILASPLVPYT